MASASTHVAAFLVAWISTKEQVCGVIPCHSGEEECGGGEDSSWMDIQLPGQGSELILPAMAKSALQEDAS